MNILPSEQGFLGLSAAEAVSFERANVVIIPFGLEASVSYGSGTAQGPQAILDASYEVELFDEVLWYEPYHDIAPVTLVPPVIAEELDTALEQLSALVTEVLEHGKLPFILGGEHALTAGAVRACAQKYDDLVILQIDAHADLRDGYEGQHYSHAAAMRRCLDFVNVSLVSVGIRNISAEEIPFLEANRERIHIYWAKDKAQWNIPEIVSHLAGKQVYLTFDLDGFDASLMPATGTPEPGGLFWDEALTLFQESVKVAHIVGADINELAPIKGFHASDFLAAKLAYKLLGFIYGKS